MGWEQMLLYTAPAACPKYSGLPGCCQACTEYNHKLLRRTHFTCPPTVFLRKACCSRHTGGVGSLAGAVQLAEVDLSNNKLTGALPALPAAVQMANMSGNAFAGGIPTSYGVILC